MNYSEKQKTFAGQIQILILKIYSAGPNPEIPNINISFIYYFLIYHTK